MMTAGIITQPVQELEVVKPYFFNAPIQDCDSATFAFFKNDSAFRYEYAKGDFYVESIGNTYGAYEKNFYFTSHPLIKDFVKGQIIFDYAVLNDQDKGLFSITLKIKFKDEATCKPVYNSIAEAFKGITPEHRGFGENGLESFFYRKQDFNHFHILFITYRKELALKGRIFYNLDLQGTDYDPPK